MEVAHAIFPLEIFGEIAGHLGNLNDLESLKACSLLCHSFLDLCRIHIFRTININCTDPQVQPGSNPITARQFANVLHKVPQIGQNVRIFVYHILPTDFDIPNIANALKSLKRLRSLDLFYAAKPTLDAASLLDWTTCPLQSELAYLLRHSNLRALKLRRVNNVSLIDLHQCTNLEELTITTDLTFSPYSSTFQASAFDLRVFSFVGEGVAGAKRLLHACRIDGTPAFDIKNLKMIDSFISNLNKPEVVSIFHHTFQRAQAIKSVRLAICCNFEGLCDKILPPKAFQTLTGLDLNFFYHQDLLNIGSPLRQLSQEFEKLVDLNQLGRIRVAFVLPFQLLYAWLENYRADWSLVDEVLTRKGWPHLKNVDIALWVRLFRTEPPEIAITEQEAGILVKGYLNKMRAAGLHRLNTSKTVKLELAFSTRY
ncbi:hypothetical protein CPB83DRAFT_851706 [Crepidotus variabilis]|uniref:F-box domain-containing protein n=1 Tax=Crepidotus variabilis TaxID=179855 RepID=A0A9P6EHP4_9AGAR|nr:hypothetical protein CPB83DRAFT_851706 [Crepidotus variabilis]